MTTGSVLTPCTLALSLVCQLRAQAEVHHHLSFAIGDESARVTVRVTGWRGRSMEVRMAGWSSRCAPGIWSRNTAQAGFTLRAQASDRAIDVTPRSSHEWSVQPQGGAVTLRYEIPLISRRHADGLGHRYPRTVERDGKPLTVRYHEAFALHGGTTWLQIDAARQRITFDLPIDFKVATGLPKAADGSYQYSGFGSMHIGKFEALSFEVDGHPHRVVLSGFGPDRTDRKALTDRLTRIVQANRRSMGPLPYARYTFLIGRRSSSPRSVGHAGSADVIAPSLQETGVLSRNLARAHLAAWDGSFFHPTSRDGIDADQKTLTADAWFWLGAREYLTELAVVRAGLAEPEAFWTRTIVAHINNLQLDKRRLEHSVAATGARMRHAMEQARGAPHPRLVGLLLCLLLDVEIRAGSGGRRSLHDAIRDVRTQCETRHHGYTFGDIRTACERAAGHPLRKLFACVNTASELPLTVTLLKIGIDARPGAGTKPKPPTSKRAPKRRRRPPRWRVALVEEPSKAVLDLRTAITR